MKKILTFAVSLLTVAAAWAQTESNLVMQVNLKSGTTVEYPLSEIQDLTFSQPQEVVLPLAINVPTNFSASYVMKVMAGGKKVAEIDQEYVTPLGQVVVIYPCDEEGRADLTKGITTTGAAVSWNTETKKPTVGEAAGEAVATFYMVDGKIETAYDGETQEAAVTPELLADIRGSEAETYRLVKIGLQYWTADNIRATRWTDGTPITAYEATQSADWKGTKEGGYLKDSQADWVKIAGLLYNGYCAVSDKMAPAGWRVPTCADYGDIRTSVGAHTAKLYKDSAPGSWSDGNTGTNETGFSAVATGYFTPEGGIASMYSDTYIWTSDSSYDALSKADAIDYFRVTATGANAVFPTKGLNPHSYMFGHCLRFVRE